MAVVPERTNFLDDCSGGVVEAKEVSYFFQCLFFILVSVYSLGLLMLTDFVHDRTSRTTRT
jgi:hypothetical protein